MLKLFFVAIILIFTGQVRSKVFTKCELVKELVEVHNANVESAKKLVCVALQSSGFDTQYSRESSFGIFNISCGAEDSRWDCDNTCESYLDDDIENDFKCAEKILNQEMFLDSSFNIEHRELNFSDCADDNLYKKLPIASKIEDGDDEATHNSFNLSSLAETRQNSEEIHEENETIEILRQDNGQHELTSRSRLEMLLAIHYLVKKEPKIDSNFVFVFI